MKDTLGVLVTYHNEKTLLTECLDSLLNQEEKPDEIIVYDDASEFPAEKYLTEVSPIKIIRGTAQKGPAVARNILLNSSQSNYIHFHDCDDLFHKSWCKRIRKAIKESNAGLIISEVSSYKDGKLSENCIMNLGRFKSGDDFIKFVLRHAILTSSTVIRRDWAMKIKGFRECLLQSEDYDFHIRLIAAGIDYLIILEPLILKRSRDTSYSKINDKYINYFLD